MTKNVNFQRMLNKPVEKAVVFIDVSFSYCLPLQYFSTLQIWFSHRRIKVNAKKVCPIYSTFNMASLLLSTSIIASADTVQFPWTISW